MALRYSLFFIFTLSGFSGLIYESIWTHYLKLFLGHAAYAQTLVLIIFLGGLAGGAALSSRYSTSWTGLIRKYAYIEGSIGLIALVFHDAFVISTGFAYTHMLPALADSPAILQTAKYALAAALILPQSILLGMTFPLMVSGFLRIYPHKQTRSISILYFTNSFGAALGVLASAFVLIDMTGLPGTVLTAGAINLTLALLTWALVRHHPVENTHTTTTGLPKDDISDRFKTSGRLVIPLLLISALTGFSSFLYEIGWIRMLTLVMGSSTHSFEVMLAVFIFGLASGSLWLSFRSPKTLNPWRMLAIAQIVMGVSALLSIWVYISSFDMMAMFLTGLKHIDATYPAYVIFSGLLAFLIMFPATFCAGMTLPLATRLMLGTHMSEKGVGAIYTLNTCGAIAAIALATHALMPLIGLKGLIVTGSFIDIVLGLSIVWFLLSDNHRNRSRTIILLTVPLAVISTLLIAVSEWDVRKLSSGVFRYATSHDHAEVVFYKDGKTSTIAVKDYPNEERTRTLTSNGKPDASISTLTDAQRTGDEATQFLLGALPIIHKPDAHDVAVIGLGTGITPSTILHSPRVKNIDTIEIEQSVIEASEYFRPFSSLVHDDPRSTIHIDDAKTFFSSRQKNYDIIISEPSNPWVSGVSSLFTKEFYSHVRRHLNDDGIFVQWVQLYEIDTLLVATILNAIAEEFNDYSIYSVNAVDIVIIASPSGRLPEIDNKAWDYHGLSEELAMHDIHSTSDIRARLIGKKHYLHPYISSTYNAVNSDYFPILDSGAARSRFTHDTATSLLHLQRSNPFPLFRILREVDIDPDQVTYNRYQEETSRYYNAIRLANYLASDSSVGSFGDKDNADLQRWSRTTLLKQMLSDCSSASYDTIIDSLFTLSTETIPYLREKTVDTMIYKLRQYQCFQNPPLNTWLDTYTSLNNEDWDSLYSLSTQLLNESVALSDSQKQYLTTSIMYSSLQLKHIDAQQVWNQISNKAGHPDLLLKLLLARSGVSI